jgi:hypothetical protein
LKQHQNKPDIETQQKPIKGKNYTINNYRTGNGKNNVE